MEATKIKVIPGRQGRSLVKSPLKRGVDTRHPAIDGDPAGTPRPRPSLSCAAEGVTHAARQLHRDRGLPSTLPSAKVPADRGARSIHIHIWPRFHSSALPHARRFPRAWGFVGEWEERGLDVHHTPQAYYEPNAHRANLVVLTGIHATRVPFDPPRPPQWARTSSRAASSSSWRA